MDIHHIFFLSPHIHVIIGCLYLHFMCSILKLRFSPAEQTPWTFHLKSSWNQHEIDDSIHIFFLSNTHIMSIYIYISYIYIRYIYIYQIYVYQICNYQIYVFPASHLFYKNPSIDSCPPPALRGALATRPPRRGPGAIAAPAPARCCSAPSPRVVALRSDRGPF